MGNKKQYPNITPASLLVILRPHLPSLPRDGRTYLKTPVKYIIQQVAGGEYYRFGLEEEVKYKFQKDSSLCLRPTLTI